MLKALSLLTASFSQNSIKQIRQLVKVACIVNILPCNFFQLTFKILIRANSNSNDVNIFGL